VRFGNALICVDRAVRHRALHSLQVIAFAESVDHGAQYGDAVHQSTIIPFTIGLSAQAARRPVVTTSVRKKYMQ